MKYLQFDKTELINLEQSLHKELLRTNKSGAYSCTTVVDCNTRKYHGLLVVPIPELDDDNHVLLSSLDETVIQHGAEFNLGLHKYSDENFSPRGHKYIREFNCDAVSRTTYRVGGIILSKEKVFSSHENRFLLKYTLIDAHSPTTLRLKPFMAFRSVKMLTNENNDANKEYLLIDNGICTSMYRGYPLLYMQLSKKNEFVFTPDWYRGIEYLKDQERGFYAKEDLYVPGYFEFPIKKGESIYFSAGLSETSSKNLKTLWEWEVKSRTPRTDFYNCLKTAAQQFYNRRDHESLYIIAGYPWFKVRARDLFVSLPGTTLSIGEKKNFFEIMNTAQKAIYKFILEAKQDKVIQEIEQPDVLLWAIWSIQQLHKEDPKAAKEHYSTLVLDIIHFIERNIHSNLHLRDNKLLSCEGKQKAVSWMNATSGGVPIVARTGYLVEVNALWYNAILFAAHLSKELGHEDQYDQLSRLGQIVGANFVAKFKNQHGYLFDFIDENTPNWNVRPNMVFALALDYSPLNKQERKQCLDYITRELLTPKGIRSLSPKSSGYNPHYEGPQVQRDFAYHQGTAWPWLTGFYLEAYLKIFKASGISFAHRALIGFEDEMRNHSIGTLAELFDGNPPFKARGAISFAMNVAEILRIKVLINQYEREYQL
ncbi:MAG: glycogen debranching enzyme N-terminal domain-containing protein [Bacteroidales bacterium]